MILPIRLADIAATADRWTTTAGSVWADAGNDHLVIVEHNGQPVPFADPIPHTEVDHVWGPLTPARPAVSA